MPLLTLYVPFLPNSFHIFNLVSSFYICVYHFFILFSFYFTFILLWLPRDTFYNNVWFDFITDRIQFHYNIRYRKFSLSCKRFKTKKEMKRNNCYVFLKNMIFIYVFTIFLFYQGIIGGCSSQRVFIGIFQNIFQHWPIIFCQSSKIVLWTSCVFP